MINANIAEPYRIAIAQKTRFFAENGVEVPAVSAFQIREIERVARTSYGRDPLYATERAGIALALLATTELLRGGNRNPKIIVLAGAGKSSETGICAARHLAEMNVNVSICLSNPPFAGHPLSYQHRLYRSANGDEIQLWNLQDEEPDLIIDTLLDSGSRESVAAGNIAGMIRWANRTAPILSFDVPSGIEPTTGDVRGEAIDPVWTLTPGLPKTGLIQERTGVLYLADVGLNADSIRKAGIQYINPFHNKLWIQLVSETGAPGLDW